MLSNEQPGNAENNACIWKTLKGRSDRSGERVTWATSGALVKWCCNTVLAVSSTSLGLPLCIITSVIHILSHIIYDPFSTSRSKQLLQPEPKFSASDATPPIHPSQKYPRPIPTRQQVNNTAQSTWRNTLNIQDIAVLGLSQNPVPRNLMV